MIRGLEVHLLDLAMSLSSTMDLIDPALVDHQKQVAYIALSIGQELGLPTRKQNELALAGILHDCGALYLKERLSLMRFRLEDPQRHAELGYVLLKDFEPLSEIALLVRYHHVPWKNGPAFETKGVKVPMGSYILHLADRVDVLVTKQEEVLGQVKRICKIIVEQSGTMFSPELVDVFLNLANREYFWFDLVTPTLSPILRRGSRLEIVELDTAGILGLANVFRQIIDFRSRFTATHSTGVAASAEALARLAGFSEGECRMMKVAGYLHDLGKVAVPAEILEKPAKLTEDEFNVIKSHTFHTYRALEPISDLDTTNAWGAFHHERLDGNGYPFHIKGEHLSMGSRIMGVADIFTALVEDRPYRKGMGLERALQIIQEMADDGALDASIVALLRLHMGEISHISLAAQTASSEQYQRFSQSLA